MKKIFNKKFLCMCMALVMCVAMAIPAFAASRDVTPVSEPQPDSGYTVVEGTSFSFIKALIMDENANVPDIVFEYSIAPGAAVDYDYNSKMEIISPSAETGVTGTPTINTAVYKPGDATVTSYEGVTINAGQKAAIKTLTVDFSGVTFAEPGIYRYLITETSAGQQAITYDTQAPDATVSKQRTLDVYVTDNNGELVVSEYVLHELVNDVAAGTDLGSDVDAQLADKSIGFVNDYTTYDLTISKTVAGNQGSHDKYFKFVVEIQNAGKNVSLDVDMSNAETAPFKSVATIYAAADMAAANGADDSVDAAATKWFYNGNEYASLEAAQAACDALGGDRADITDNAVVGLPGQQWVTDANGNVTKTVYLKHGQSIQIKGLAAGATYTITEDFEDYKPNFENGITADSDGMDADATEAYTNTRDGVIPTGIVLSLIPGIAVAALGGLGIFAFAKKSKKEDEE